MNGGNNSGKGYGRIQLNQPPVRQEFMNGNIMGRFGRDETVTVHCKKREKASAHLAHLGFCRHAKSNRKNQKS